MNYNSKIKHGKQIGNQKALLNLNIATLFNPERLSDNGTLDTFLHNQTGDAQYGSVQTK